MSESATFKVFRAASLREQIILAGNFAKSLLDAGLMIQIIVKVLAKSRTGEQNDTLHGLCSNCADQLLWVGRKLDTEGWKRLMVDAWARATDQKAGDIVPSLDGLSVVTLNRSTAKMKSAELAELIEFVLAEGTTRGVKFKYLANREMAA
jgi:hypothetical protein